MTQDVTHDADGVLDGAVRADAPVAGVVAMVTDREGTVYEGTAGVRRLGGADPMTTDTVFALFSCTKAITATAALQLVEEGLLDLDAPARGYVAEIGDWKVLTPKSWSLAFMINDEPAPTGRPAGVLG